jgi:hypothetical protein
MKPPYIKAIGVVAIVVFLLSCVPLGETQQTQKVVSFQLLNRPEGDQAYQLNVTITQSLVNYYTAKSHSLFSPNDFPKYVTTYALKPVAERLWQIYDNKEDFANGVLMLVHQITYKEIAMGKYPAETLMDGYGDCDLFAYIAASILEAGGIDTVLLYYKEQKHMEIGVDIGAEPSDSRVEFFSVQYQNVSYYICECTGTQWRNGWRAGECPSEFQNSTVQVVPLSNIDQAAPEQVTATLKELDPSTLTLQTLGSLTLEGNILNIKGQLQPQIANQNITLQAKTDTQDWTTLGSILTDADGSFQYSWTPPMGSVTVQASWLGNKEYNGAKSTENSTIVVPRYLLAVIGTAVIGVGVVTFTFIVTRRRKTDLPQPTQPPEPTTPSPPAPDQPI